MGPASWPVFRSTRQAERLTTDQVIVLDDEALNAGGQVRVQLPKPAGAWPAATPMGYRSPRLLRRNCVGSRGSVLDTEIDSALLGLM